MATKDTTATSAMANLEIRDFSGGMLDKVDDALLPENASSDCQNFISDTVGKLRKRPGQLKFSTTSLGGAVQGMYPYYYGTTSAFIAAANGSVYKKKYTTAVVEVWTATDLYNVRNDLTKTYVQMANIDLSGYASWTPIGTDAARFSGTYDGNGFTISNLCINAITTDYQGLFGVIHADGVVTAVNLII